MTQKSSASAPAIAQLWTRAVGGREALYFETVSKRNVAAVGRVLRWAGGRIEKKNNILAKYGGV